MVNARQHRDVQLNGMGIVLLIASVGLISQAVGPEASTAELPSLSSIPAANHQAYRFHTAVLHQERMLLVHLPEGYEDSVKSYPVHFVLDGEFLFPVVAANIEFLAEARVVDMLMPETIVVGVVNMVRDTDYTPTTGTDSEFEMFPHTGGGERFLRFLADELIPLVDANFRTNGYRLLTGWSFSGLFTVYTMTERPDLFNAYHAISPSIWWDEDLVIEAFAKKAFKRPTKLFTSLGSIEIDGWTYNANKKLAKILTDTPVENLEFTHIEIADVGHHLGVPQSVDRALRTFYRDYLAPGEVVEGGLGAVKAYYKELSKAYGYEVEIPYRIYESLGTGFWEEGKDDAEAVKVFQNCVAAYPDYPMAHFYLGVSYSYVNELERAVDCIETALQVERRRAIPDASNLLLFQERLDIIQEKMKEAR